MNNKTTTLEATLNKSDRDIDHMVLEVKAKLEEASYYIDQAINAINPTQRKDMDVHKCIDAVQYASVCLQASVMDITEEAPTMSEEEKADGWILPSSLTTEG